MIFLFKTGECHLSVKYFSNGHSFLLLYHFGELQTDGLAHVTTARKVKLSKQFKIFLGKPRTSKNSSTLFWQTPPPKVIYLTPKQILEHPQTTSLLRQNNGKNMFPTTLTIAWCIKHAFSVKRLNLFYCRILIICSLCSYKVWCPCVKILRMVCKHVLLSLNLHLGVLLKIWYQKKAERGFVHFFLHTISLNSDDWISQ